jgi:hypothetical protein
MLLKACIAAGVLLAGDGGIQPAIDFRAPAEDAGDQLDFDLVSQIERLGWASPPERAVERIKGLRRSASGPLCLRRGDVETCLGYVAGGLQRFEIRFLEPTNVLASVRARWGEPQEVKPAIDLVQYVWTRPDSVVSVEEQVESAGTGFGTMAATRRVVVQKRPTARRSPP